MKKLQCSGGLQDPPPCIMVRVQPGATGCTRGSSGDEILQRSPFAPLLGLHQP
jgi:hypothetical protein